jgi:DeoR/GlpR family transcriptional regulator of sugar metabolism
LEFLKEKGRVQVWEVSKLFPDISKRTIRRDFLELLNSGLIQRIGEKNNTFYQL